jgi:hypothetical protein
VDIVDQLREKIDSEHKEALEALARVTAYLRRTETTPPTRRTKSGKSSKAAVSNNGSGSIRGRVLPLIAKDWWSVRALVEKTGLTVRQVRGVLNAPVVSDSIETRDHEGAREYRYTGKDQQTD